jgi:hypothetical protein
MRKTYSGVLSRSTAINSRWKPPQPMQVGGGICSLGSAIFPLPSNQRQAEGKGC